MSLKLMLGPLLSACVVTLIIFPVLHHNADCTFWSLKMGSMSSYRNDPIFSDRQAWANSVDPDQYDQGLGSTLFAIPSASFGPITL